MDSAAATPAIRYDGKITIAIGRSRKETEWRNREMLWSELVERLSSTKRTDETFEEFKALPKAKQDAIKDVGGFVGGSLKGGRRKADNVAWRSVVTLDADFVKGDLWAGVETFWDFAVAMYSTHKHTPEAPRLRLVIPLSRPVTPDEYAAISRKLAEDMGIDMFDDTTFEPHRLMYWPSTSKDGEFVFRVQDAPWLNPDDVLARYPDWRDPSYWPESSRTKRERQKQVEKQGDPLEKPGVVGAFCRTYTISAAIEAFLSDVYEPAGPNRYTYVPGSTTGGLVVYDDDRFAYSHHGTDPVSGKLVNAFDLVRIHLFGHLDDDAEAGTPTIRLPSYLEMVRFASEDEAVQHTLAEERLRTAEEDFREGRADPKQLFFDKNQFVPMWLGQWFLRDKHAFVLNNELYLYQDGVYRPAERMFHEVATAVLGKEFRTHRANEALAWVKNSVRVVSPSEAINTGDYLNVKNGILDLNTFELLPHSPDLLTTIQLPVEYDPEAKCPAIDEFFKRVLPDGCEPLIEEMIGYCLIPSTAYEKAFLFYGEGGNGKGTLIAVLAALFGAENVSSVPLQQLSEHRFAAAQLFGKLVNLHADIPASVIEDSSRFKELVSGDWITAEEKFKASFQFRNRAKLIFSMNEIPATRDLTYGFFRRLIIIPFPNRFDDRELRARLFEPKELSGLLNRALRGLDRLRRQGHFTEPEATRAAFEAYREKTDSVFRFVKECCVLEDGAMVGKQELYNAYRQACIEWGMRPVSQANFNQRLRAIHPAVSEYRYGTPRRWKGLRLLNLDFLE